VRVKPHAGGCGKFHASQTVVVRTALTMHHVPSHRSEFVRQSVCNIFLVKIFENAAGKEASHFCKDVIIIYYKLAIFTIHRRQLGRVVMAPVSGQPDSNILVRKSEGSNPSVVRIF
jgi:hypothetical protein